MPRSPPARPPPHRIPRAPSAACAAIAESPRLPPAKPPPRARAKSPAPRSSPCPKSDISAAASFAAQVPVEKLRRPPERVDQRLIPHEYVALLRIVDFREILPLVDQLLAKLHRILEHYVIVHNSVHHQKRVLQHAGKVDRRAAPVSFGILLRLAQPLFRVVRSEEHTSELQS